MLYRRDDVTDLRRADRVRLSLSLSLSQLSIAFELLINFPILDFT